LAAPAAATVPGRLPGEVVVERLANGLTVGVLANRQAPVVTTALWYRVASRHEPAGQAGVAHFLEHMMFKGSPRFGPGAIDRRTQALGGDDNAFTSHDATAYYFSFAADRWREALAIEADRMESLLLAPEEVEGERRVILEEIAMYEAEPWDALEERVLAALFGGHPYGRPVLGTRRDLLATGRDELAAFHRHHYRPSNAVLVVGGEVGDEAFAAAAEAFAGVADRPGGTALPAVPPAAPPAGLRRVEQRMGEVPRLLLALPAPAADHPDHALLRLATVVLGSGRASRLHRRLVDEENLCVWAAADVGETVEPGALTVSLELVPGAEPAEVEARVLAELAALAEGRGPVTPIELERARRVVTADWVFGHERVHQQALAAGFALALFDLGHAERSLGRALAAGSDELGAVAARWLVPERGAVVGWSLPRQGGR
jgi:zinc protease